MPIPYLPGKKTDKSGDIPKELYYVIPRVLQKKGKPINEKQIADNLAEQSSLMSGDVLSVLEQLPAEIAEQLKQGRTVNIRGMGTFFLSISSVGVENRKDCRPSTIRDMRICFKADKEFKKLMDNCEFQNLDDL